MREAFTRNLGTELVSELAKITGLAGLLLLIIYRLVTRHLQDLARQVANLKPGSALAPVMLHRHGGRRDELDTLVKLINRFRSERVDAEQALLRDIAERNRVEAALSKTEIALSEALQIAELAYWEYYPLTQEFVLNDQYYSLHRARAEEFGGYRNTLDFFRRLVHPEDATSFGAYIQAALQASGADRPGSLKLASSALMAVRWMLVRCKLERDSAGEIVRLIGASQDMTERKRAEEALRSTQLELARVTQLSTMGQMAASIAHEINQPLAAIVANGSAGLRWLASKTPNVGEAQAAMESIVQDGHRAGNVINGIRAMFKKDARLRRHLLDLNQVIAEVLTLVHTDTLSGVSVRTELTEDLPQVLGSRVQLQQVILNLIANALDAMGSAAEGARVLRLKSERNGHPMRHASLSRTAVRASTESHGANLPPVLYDEIQRHGDGPVDLPVDRRGPWRPALGIVRHRTGIGLSDCFARGRG